MALNMNVYTMQSDVGNISVYDSYDSSGYNVNIV